MLSALFLARLLLGLRLPDLPSTVPRWYVPLTGAVWGSAALVTGVGLLAGMRWAAGAARLGATAFAAWAWADRLLLVHTDFALGSWPAAAAITLVALGLTFWALSRPHVRRYFGRTMNE
jgi:hypothetical protein